MNKKSFVISLIPGIYCSHLKLFLKSGSTLSKTTISLITSFILGITSFFVLHLMLTPNKAYAFNIAAGPSLQIADSSINSRILTARTYYFERIGIGGYATIYGDIIPLVSYNICIESVYNLSHRTALMANTKKSFYEFFRKISKKTRPDKDLNYQFDKYLPLVWLKFHSLYCPITFKILLNIGPYFSTYLGSVLNIKYFLGTEERKRSEIDEKVYWNQNFVPTKKYNDLYFNLGAVFGIRACTLGNFLDLDLCLLSITTCLYNADTNKAKNKNKTRSKYHHIGKELSTQISLRCDMLSLIYTSKRKRYISSKDRPLDY